MKQPTPRQTRCACVRLYLLFFQEGTPCFSDSLDTTLDHHGSPVSTLTELVLRPALKSADPTRAHPSLPTCRCLFAAWLTPDGCAGCWGYVAAFPCGRTDGLGTGRHWAVPLLRRDFVQPGGGCWARGPGFSGPATSWRPCQTCVQVELGQAFADRDMGNHCNK